MHFLQEVQKPVCPPVLDGTWGLLWWQWQRCEQACGAAAPTDRDSFLQWLQSSPQITGTFVKTGALDCADVAPLCASQTQELWDDESSTPHGKYRTRCDSSFTIPVMAQ